MKAVAKILVYLLAVLALGALLAPRVFWTAHDMEQWALANRLMTWDPYHSDVVVNGPLGFLTREFARCLMPALFLAALLLALPGALWMDVASAGAMRLAPNPRPLRHLWRGFITTTLLFSLLGFALVLANICALRRPIPSAQIVVGFVGSLPLACVVETIFRGAIFGALRRAIPSNAALIWSTLFFAIFVLFRRAPIQGAQHVTWLSGFDLLRQMPGAFRGPAFLLDFVPALVLGFLLGYARMQTDSLWLGIGLLWGVLFAALGFDALATALPGAHFWVGAGLLAGPLPALILALALFYISLRLAREDILPNRAPRD